MFDIQVGDRFCHHGDGVLDYLDLCWSASDDVTIEWDGFGRKGFKAIAYNESDEILDQVVVGIKEIDRNTWEVVSVDRGVLLYTDEVGMIWPDKGGHAAARAAASEG